MKGAIMAKKHLELENVTVFYDFKDDSIKLTCKDPILEGKRFNLTLNQGSETEETLRKVLINEGFIERKREPIPEKKLIDVDFGRGIPIGSSFDKDIYWNPIVDNLPPALLIAGDPGTGKTYLMENMIDYCVESGDWEIYHYNERDLDFHKMYENLDNYHFNNRLNGIGELVVEAAQSDKDKKTIVFIDDLMGDWFDNIPEYIFCEQLMSIISHARSRNNYFVFSIQSVINFRRYMPLDYFSKILFSTSYRDESFAMFGTGIANRTLLHRQPLGMGYISMGGETPVQFRVFTGGSDA